MENKKQLLTDFLNELKEQVGTYRIKDIETERAVKVFLESKRNYFTKDEIRSFKIGKK